MGVHDPHALPHQFVSFDKVQDFALNGDRYVWEFEKHCEEGSSVSQVAQRQLSDHEWMGGHGGGVEQGLHPDIAHSEEVHPDRRIHKGHLASP